MNASLSSASTYPRRRWGSCKPQDRRSGNNHLNMKTCITHPDILVKETTMWGVRWKCPVFGCSVIWWDGPTSTPADAETRKLRSKCHELFDPLWKERVLFKRRVDAYKWMSEVMETKKGETHIGMFNKEQCLKLLEALKANPLPPNPSQQPNF